MHHVFNEPVVEHAGHGAAVHHPVKGQEQDLGILGNQKGHHGQIVAAAGKGLAEQLVPAHPHQHGLIAPQVLLDHVHAALQDDTDVPDVLLLEGDDVAPAEGSDVIPDAAQHGFAVLGSHAVEQRGVDLRQNVFHCHRLLDPKCPFLRGPVLPADMSASL